MLKLCVSNIFNILIMFAILYYNFCIRQIIGLHYYKKHLTIVFFAKFLFIFSKDGIDFEIINKTE